MTHSTNEFINSPLLAPFAPWATPSLLRS